MEADNNFAHAWDYETPAEYLQAKIEKELYKNDKFCFEAEIMKNVKKEYKRELTRPFKQQVMSGAIDHILPKGDFQDIEDGYMQKNIDDINQKHKI